MAEITLCQKCGKSLPNHIEKCPYCGGKQARQDFQKMTGAISNGYDMLKSKSATMQVPTLEVPDKYPALWICLAFVKISAIAPLIGTIIMMIKYDYPAQINTIGIFISLLWGIIIWAVSESIQVFIDMESNQRKLILTLEHKQND